MNKKILLITVLFLLLMFVVSAVSAGENYIVTNINRCYGEITISIRGINFIQEDEYSFVNCNKVSLENQVYWRCICNEDISTDVVLLTKENTENEYDIVVEYFESELINVSVNKSFIPTKEEVENELKKRTLHFNDIVVSPNNKKPVRPPLEFPLMGDAIKIVFIIIIILVIICGVIFVIWKWLDKDEDRIKKTAVHKPKKNVKEDADEIFRKYVDE